MDEGDVHQEDDKSLFSHFDDLNAHQVAFLHKWIAEKLQETAKKQGKDVVQLAVFSQRFGALHPGTSDADFGKAPTVLGGIGKPQRVSVGRSLWARGDRRFCKKDLQGHRQHYS
jgi:hypothetical protein